MKIKTGVFIIVISIAILSFFGKNDDTSLTTSEMIMTKADATAYWDSIAE